MYKRQHNKLNVVNSKYSSSRKSTHSQPKAKVVFLGDTSVGKTSIITKYTKDCFLSEPKVTIGGAYSNKTINIDSERSIELHIWDTGGSEEAKTMASLYYRKAKAGLVTFDLTNANTFHDYWANEIS